MQQFDLQGYASKYQGYTKTARLTFIGERSKDCLMLQKDAYQMALEILKVGSNMALYQKVAKDSSGLFEENYFDQELVESVEKKNHQMQVTLEGELNSYKSNMIKESIRVCTNPFSCHCILVVLNCY